MRDARDEQAATTDDSGEESDFRVIKRSLDAAWERCQSGDFDGAKAMIEAEREKHPDSAAVLLYAGRVYRCSDGPAAGLPFFRRTQELSLNDPQYLMPLATEYFFAGERAQAIEIVEDILLHNSDWGGRLGAMTYRDYFQEDYETVVRDLEAVPNLARRSPYFAMMLAYSLYKLQRFANAASVCRELIAAKENSAWIQSLLGWSEQRLGNYKAALDAFEAAVALKSRVLGDYRQVIRLSLRLGRFRAAWACFRTVIENAEVLA